MSDGTAGRGVPEVAGEATPDVTAPDTWPEGLRAAFDAYESALMRDDVAALDALFAPGPDTLRGDASGLLVGHDRISAFRTGRGGVAARTIGRVEVRVLADRDVLTVGESLFAGGGRGLQTQLWHRGDDGAWRVAAAHVTGRPKLFDRSIWRVVGDPLVHGSGSGPLAGVRVAVKDLYDVAGHIVGAGNPTWEATAPVATSHADAVAALLDAGADVTGLARTDEFAYSIAGRNQHTGTPPNGAAPDRAPGGSTSGPTSAVSTGLADLALGTDTAGSIRVPASYQGLWGLRTTHGAVSRSGLLPLAQTFDTVGWIARDAATVRAAAIASGLGDHRADGGPGDAANEDPTPSAGVPFAVCDALLDSAEPGTRDAFAAWVGRNRLNPVRVELPPLAEVAETLRVVQAAEAWRNDGAWVSQHRDALAADVLGRFDAAAAVTEAAEAAARVRLTSLRQAVRTALDGVILIMPAVPGPAPLLTATGTVEATRAATLRMTGIAGIGGLPCAVAPFLLVDGAPVGVAFVGAAGSDVAILDRAVALQA